jgi:hypothetical protein
MCLSKYPLVKQNQWPPHGEGTFGPHIHYVFCMLLILAIFCYFSYYTGTLVLVLLRAFIFFQFK